MSNAFHIAPVNGEYTIASLYATVFVGWTADQDFMDLRVHEKSN